MSIASDAGRSFSAGHDLEHVGGSSEQREFEAAGLDLLLLQMSPQAVKSLLARARDNLRDALQPYLNSGVRPEPGMRSADE